MQESIAEPLLEKVRVRMSTLRVGPPARQGSRCGAIVARVQLERIQRLVEQGIAEARRVGSHRDSPCRREGLLSPDVTGNVHPASIVAQQEFLDRCWLR